jgi:hypothetical protein
MIELEKKSERVEKMMEFSGMLNGQTGNKTCQELKKEKATGKNAINHVTSEQFHNALEKLKNADKELIEEFDNTLMDGLDKMSPTHFQDDLAQWDLCTGKGIVLRS